MYHVSMTSFRMSVTVLAVMHALFAGFTALVGAFANGGDIWQRLLVVLLHPLGARRCRRPRWAVRLPAAFFFF